MKRILALLLALSMLFALTACEKDAESTDGTTDTTGTSAPTNSTQSTTETTTATDSTTATESTTEAPSTEPCDHSYSTDGLTDCNGIMTYICSKCQHSYGVETGKYWHEWKHYYTKQPTLTEVK